MTEYRMTPYRPNTPWLALVLVLAAAPAPAAEYGPAQVRIQMNAYQVAAEGNLAVPVGRALAWQVLSDHEGFPAFVPGLLASRVLETRGNEKIIAQRGEITAGPRLRFDGTLRVEEHPGEGVRVRFLTGPFRDSEGEWQLAGDRPVTLTYRLRIDLTKTPLPPPMAGAVAEQQVRVWLAALAGEMERRQGGKR
jgi:ribosome-associated toxin RatA of RatAB toxin-antitoxin module